MQQSAFAPAGEFGRLIRRHRDRVSPEAVGVPLGRRRRAAGLRREELAALAGISADYLTRLEQGRATSPSAQVVEALARALRVSDGERGTLFLAAGLLPPGPDVVPTRIAPSVQRMLDRLEHTPVAVFDASWTLLLANQPYDAVLGATTAWRGIERNALWRNLAGLGNRVVHTPDGLANLQRGQVAALRQTVGRYPGDRALRALVAELSRLPRFVELWEASDTEPLRESSRRKTIEHPSMGRITLDCDVLIVANDDLRVMIYTAEPGTEDAQRLELAIVLGTQALVG